MKFWYYHFWLLVFFYCSQALAQTQTGERFDEELPAPILSTEQWRKLKPGQVHQGYFKLNALWNNHWPLCWYLKGDHLKLTKLHDWWVRKHYYKRSHRARIHDPQDYLSDIEKEVLTDILKNHDKVSQLPIHLFIFGAGQQLVHLDARTVAEEFLKKPNSALMFYFMGDAKATTGFVKTKKPPKIPGADKDEEPKPLVDPFLIQTLFIKAGAHAATLNEDPSETLYATVAEVSRRMYWIEQELGLVTPAKPVVDETETKQEPTEEEPSAVDKLWKQLGGNKQNLVYLGSGILIAILFSITVIALKIYRRLKIYQFPSYQGSTRLAAKYGAGVFEILAFKDVRVSLSDQKKRLEDSEV